MTAVTPSGLNLNVLHVIRNRHLGSLGLSAGDQVQIVPCRRYDSGDIVLAQVEGFYLIGKLQLHPSPTLLHPKQRSVQEIRIGLANLIGCVCKADQVAPAS